MIIKRGTTFAFFINLPEGLSITDIKCQIKDHRDNLIDTLVLTKQSDIQYLARSSDTSNYPIGELLFDIKIWTGEITFTSDTQTITVIKEVTI